LTGTEGRKITVIFGDLSSDAGKENEGKQKTEMKGPKEKGRQKTRSISTGGEFCVQRRHGEQKWSGVHLSRGGDDVGEGGECKKIGRGTLKNLARVEGGGKNAVLGRPDITW